MAGLAQQRDATNPPSPSDPACMTFKHTADT